MTRISLLKAAAEISNEVVHIYMGHQIEQRLIISTGHKADSTSAAHHSSTASRATENSIIVSPATLKHQQQQPFVQPATSAEQNQSKSTAASIRQCFKTEISNHATSTTAASRPCFKQTQQPSNNIWMYPATQPESECDSHTTSTICQPPNHQAVLASGRNESNSPVHRKGRNLLIIMLTSGVWEFITKTQPLKINTNTIICQYSKQYTYGISRV